MAQKRMLGINARDAKYVMTDVQEADILDFGNSALEAFKVNDPEVSVNDIIVVQIEHGTMNTRTSFLKDIANPPAPQPVKIVTHSKE